MNQHDVAPLSQLAAAWRDEQLGTCSDATIGSDGCLVTCYAMLARVTPLAVNTRMIERGLFYAGCLARTFDAQRIGFPTAPPLAGVTQTYQSVAFPAREISRVWAHVAAGNAAIACVDADSTTARFDQHWILLVGAFGWPDARRDFIVNDPNGGIQTSFRERYGDLARALVRVALYGGGALSRDIGDADARQMRRATIPKEAIRDK